MGVASAIRIVACQPRVRLFLFFHVSDESRLEGLQTGVYYADDTPKSSLAAVSLAIAQSLRGVITSCPGVELTPKPTVTQKGAVLTLTCDIDCTFVAQLYRVPGRLLVSKHGRAVGGRATTLPLRVPVARGSYRLRLSAVAPLNPGPAATLRRAIRPG